jgi:zinc transport system permease protein
MNLDLLLEPFALRALAASVAVGVAAPVIGSFLVQRRLALIGDAMGHLAFAGVGVGVLVGVSPLWGALAVAVLGGVALERLRMRGQLGGDLTLALVFYAGIAGGVVILSASGRFDASVIGVLFGSILTTSWGDVALIAGLCVAVVLVTSVFYQPLLAVALDEDTARAAGLPVDGLNLLLVSLTAVLVTAGMRAVGLLLVAALLVVPVASGARLAHSFLGSVRWAVLIGVLSAVGGLVVALLEGSLAPGGTIVLASLVAFGVATAAGRRVARRHRPGVAR